jgi:preprotein translocase subunit SecF
VQLKLPNIYHYKHLKVLLAIPVLMMLFGILLSTHLQFDTTLSGGVSVLLQTNSTISPSAFASAVSSKLGVSEPTIASSPGGYQVTIPMNNSLSNAQNYLIAFFDYNANYSVQSVNATSIQIALQHNPANETLASELKTAQAQENQTLSLMSSSLGSELGELRPFINTSKYAYGTSNPQQMANVAKFAFSNASTVYKDNVISDLKSIVPFTSYSYQQVTPTLSSYFLSQVEYLIIIAFILVSISVLFIFRSPAPAFAVVFGAGNDIIVALGFMAIFRIPLGLDSLGGLLMLIGYSIDTDMLTAMRILKRHEGTPEDRAYSSMKTGITMTATAIVSFAILFIVSLVAYIPTYYEISGVVLFGLIGDIITTWFGNASIVLLYYKWRERR